MDMYHFYTREQLKKHHRTDLILYTSTAFMIGFTAALLLIVLTKGIYL